jgi:hypothetical protein
VFSSCGSVLLPGPGLRSGTLPVWVGRMPPVIGIAVALARIIGRTQNGKVGHFQRQIRTGFAAKDVIHVEVLARWKLVLVAAAQLASAIVGAQRVVPDPPPFRRLQKRRRGNESCRPAIGVALSPQKSNDKR